MMRMLCAVNAFMNNCIKLKFKWLTAAQMPFSKIHSFDNRNRMQRHQNGSTAFKWMPMLWYIFISTMSFELEIEQHLIEPANGCIHIPQNFKSLLRSKQTVGQVSCHEYYKYYASLQRSTFITSKMQHSKE